jgi:hypothetical protein
MVVVEPSRHEGVGGGGPKELAAEAQRTAVPELIISFPSGVMTPVLSLFLVPSVRRSAQNNTELPATSSFVDAKSAIAIFGTYLHLGPLYLFALSSDVCLSDCEIYYRPNIFFRYEAMLCLRSWRCGRDAGRAQNSRSAQAKAGRVRTGHTLRNSTSVLPPCRIAGRSGAISAALPHPRLVSRNTFAPVGTDKQTPTKCADEQAAAVR